MIEFLLTNLTKVCVNKYKVHYISESTVPSETFIHLEGGVRLKVNGTLTEVKDKLKI
jgi:hypothetical protein